MALAQPEPHRPANESRLPPPREASMNHYQSAVPVGRRDLLTGLGTVAAGMTFLQHAVADENNPATAVSDRVSSIRLTGPYSRLSHRQGPKGSTARHLRSFRNADRHRPYGTGNRSGSSSRWTGRCGDVRRPFGGSAGEADSTGRRPAL